MSDDQTDSIESFRPPPTAHRIHSESDLSDPDTEVIDNVTVNVNPIMSTYQDVGDEMDMSESDQDDDAEGEDDADYDVESPPPEDDNLRPASHSSHSSVRPGKRKSSMDEDDFMTQNPELYGLRRSVCFHVVSCRIIADNILAPGSSYPPGGMKLAIGLLNTSVNHMRRLTAIRMTTTRM